LPSDANKKDALFILENGLNLNLAACSMVFGLALWTDSDRKSYPQKTKCKQAFPDFSHVW